MQTFLYLSVLTISLKTYGYFACVTDLVLIAIIRWVSNTFTKEKWSMIPKMYFHSFECRFGRVLAGVSGVMNNDWMWTPFLCMTKLRNTIWSGPSVFNTIVPRHQCLFVGCQGSGMTFSFVFSRVIEIQFSLTAPVTHREVMHVQLYSYISQCRNYVRENS